MSKQHPFRFGVAIESATSRDEWIAKAHKLEELGYSVLLMPDHFVTDFSPEVALMAAADATSKLRVGSFVFDNDFRNPALLAKEVATLDVLSGGRFEFGIGGGWMPSEYEKAGIPFDPPGVRMNRLEEAIAIIKGLFSEGPLTFSGKYYTIRELDGTPKPVQKPHPPVFIGGGGKRLLSIAAREADIIGIHFKADSEGKVDIWERSSAALAQKVEWVRQAAGERFDALELNLLISEVIVMENRRQVTEEIIRARGWTKVTVEQALDMPYMLIGSVDQIVEDLQAQRERYGISYLVVFEEAMDTFAPVVARLTGR